MVSPLDVIGDAFRQAGILGRGQALNPEQTGQAFRLLNSMLGSWSKKRWLVYHLLDVACTSTGRASYAVGPGGEFNCPRPDQIDSAFARQLYGAGTSPVDWPLDVLSSREDYARIGLKGLATFPSAVYYDAGYPFGTFYVWPVPQAGAWQIHIAVKAALPTFATLEDDLDLPPEYYEALLYNLAVRLRSAFQLPPDAIVIGLAKSALDTIRSANTQVAELQMPNSLLPWWGSASGGMAWGGFGPIAYPPPPPATGGGGTGGTGGSTGTTSAAGALIDGNGQPLLDGSNAPLLDSGTQASTGGTSTGGTGGTGTSTGGTGSTGGATGGLTDGLGAALLDGSGQSLTDNGTQASTSTGSTGSTQGGGTTGGTTGTGTNTGTGTGNTTGGTSTGSTGGTGTGSTGTGTGGSTGTGTGSTSGTAAGLTDGAGGALLDGNGQSIVDAGTQASTGDGTSTGTTGNSTGDGSTGSTGSTPGGSTSGGTGSSGSTGTTTPTSAIVDGSGATLTDGDGAPILAAAA